MCSKTDQEQSFESGDTRSMMHGAEMTGKDKQNPLVLRHTCGRACVCVVGREPWRPRAKSKAWSLRVKGGMVRFGTGP